jgi:hypothetical protein
MTKKRLLLLASLPLTVLVIFGVLAMLPPRPGVTKANFDRVKEGMTLAEVEEIFGRVRDLQGASPVEGTVLMFWQETDGSWARIEFLDDRVSATVWGDSDQTIINKIRRWLHIQ